MRPVWPDDTDGDPETINARWQWDDGYKNGWADALAAHIPYACNGPFVCCSCGWIEDGKHGTWTEYHAR